jgi:hypothetical protein
MKPLNRPMFRYGGPIKEVIMTCMKEPVKRQAALVGDPVFPKAEDGRAKHFLQIPLAIGAAALRFAPAAYRGFKAARTFAPGKLGTTGRLKDIFTPKKGLGLEMGKAGEGAGFRIGSLIRQNPFLAASTPTLAYDAARIGGPAAGEGLKAIANFLVPGTRFDPFKDKKEEVPTGDGTGLKRGDKSKNVGDTSVTGTTKPGEAGGTTVKSDAEKQQINEARINETKQKYYKLMGIDKMNKDAVYDSLIDASKIVSEEGADLKGSIRSGNLQNRIIQAISGQLDKSAALKRQIDAAVLKGEIEKDIKQSDPSAAVDLAYKRAATKKIEKDLKGTSAADVLATAEIQGKNLVTSNTLTSILASKGTSVDFTFPDDKYQKWEKNNKTKDEIDYLTENYGNLDDGLYVVNKKAVQVKDGNVTFVDLDTITG